MQLRRTEGRQPGVNRKDVKLAGLLDSGPTPFGIDGALDETAWGRPLALYVEQGVFGCSSSTGAPANGSVSYGRTGRLAEIASATSTGASGGVGVAAFTAPTDLGPGPTRRSDRADGVCDSPYVHPDPQETRGFTAGGCDQRPHVCVLPTGAGRDGGPRRVPTG